MNFSLTSTYIFLLLLIRLEPIKLHSEPLQILSHAQISIPLDVKIEPATRGSEIKFMPLGFQAGANIPARCIF